MKKVILMVAVAFAALTTNAQESKGFEGSWFALGQVGFEKEGEVSSYTVLPAVGTFVAPTTAVGLAVGVIGSIDKEDATTEFKTNSFIIKPLARQYFAVTDKLFIFGQVALPFGFNNESVVTKNKSVGKVEIGGISIDIPGENVTTSSIPDAKSTSFGIEIAPGLDYFLSPNWTLEATFGLVSYNSVKPDVKGAKAVNTFKFGLNSGLLDGLKLGVKYVF